MNFLRPHADKIYAAMRILTGLLFVQHGLKKIFGLFGGAEGMPAFILYGAGGIELVGGALVAIGWFAGPAAFVSSGTMAAAFFLGHVVPKETLLPISNGGDLPILYCWIFLLIAAKGSGIWSVDAASGASAE